MTDASPRKRVRTGCLTCRKRRRKCDEVKPECDNCKTKGLVCHYSTNLTFVTSKLQDRLDTIAARPQPQSSSTLTSNPGFVSAVAPLAEDTEASDVAFQYRVPAEASSVPRQQDESPSNSQSRVNGNLRRKRYELELLTHYRYNVAPILDLGLGSSPCGVQAVHDSQHMESIFHAILAVASSHRAGVGSSMQHVDNATSVTSAHLAQDELAGVDVDHSATSNILLFWRSLCVNPVESWNSILPEVAKQAQREVRILENWQLTSRISIAALLMDNTRTYQVECFPPPEAASDGNEHAHIRHMSIALLLLEQNLVSTRSKTFSTNERPFPVSQTWLAQWHEQQSWYSARSEEMRPILELTEDIISHFQIRESLSFPCIVFSNLCAAVANVAHHISSMISIQTKPRLIKAVAEAGSSTSFLWHSQRVIGIVSAAADAKTWDPLLVAALLYAARQLSHGEQIREVSKTLKQIQSASGLNLESAIRNLGTRADQG